MRIVAGHVCSIVIQYNVTIDRTCILSTSWSYTSMGKTYYCDYCDRSFKDDVEARKKHLSSMQHMTNRASHYNMF